MFVPTSLTPAKTLKWLKHPSTDDWAKGDMLHISTTKCSSALKDRNPATCNIIDTTRGHDFKENRAITGAWEFIEIRSFNPFCVL